jgi:hypothetical protein
LNGYIKDTTRYFIRFKAPLCYSFICKKQKYSVTKANKRDSKTTGIGEGPSLNPYLTVMEKAKKPFEIYGALWGTRN